MTTGQLAAVVLCGGQSRRMGRDKAALSFGPETLLERVVRLVRVAASEVVVAAAAGQAVPQGVQVSVDTAAGGGPLPALLDALNLIQRPFVWVVACDTPLLQPALGSLLFDLCAGHDAAVPVVDGRRVPTCAVYRTAALRDRQAAFGSPRDRSLSSFVEPLDLQEVGTAELEAADPGLRSFAACNTPQEYRRALGLAGLQGIELIPETP